MAELVLVALRWKILQYVSIERLVYQLQQPEFGDFFAQILQQVEAELATDDRCCGENADTICRGTGSDAAQ